MVLKPAFALALACSAACAANATDLVVATVNNGHMIEMQKHTADFEKANPGIHLKWVTTDIATKGGPFDVMTIGMYETPIWGKKGWLKELTPDAALKFITWATSKDYIQLIAKDKGWAASEYRLRGRAN